MRFNLTPESLLNAAGGFFFLAIGVAIFALAGRTRRGFLLGGLATTFGFTYVVDNLLSYYVEPLAAFIVALAYAATTGFTVALALHLARPASPRARAGLAAAGLLLLALLVPGNAWLPWLATDAARAVIPAGVEVAPTAFFTVAFHSAATVLLLACAVAMRAAATDIERRALALLALSYGIYLVFWRVELLANSPHLAISPSTPGYATTLVAWFVGGALLALAASAFLAQGSGRGPARGVFYTLWAVGISACLFVALTDYRSDAYGLFGVTRTAGAFLLVLAIVRFDLLGVPLPRIAVDRGALAAGALAVLFIVAQILENFLDSAFGLVAGGLAAGAMLFAAHPLQRAMERVGKTGDAPLDRAGPDDNEVYRRAVRLALRDRRLTRDEEMDLHRLATRLGIPGERAHEILVEVEREREAGA